MAGYFNALLGLVMTLGAVHSWEWVGVFELEHEAVYGLKFSMVDGAYAEDSIKLNVVELGESEDYAAALAEAMELAEDVMDSYCDEEVAAGGELEIPGCHTLLMDSNSTTSHFDVEIHEHDHDRRRLEEHEHAFFAVFAEHELSEFEADDHYLKDEDGEDQRPTPMTMFEKCSRGKRGKLVIVVVGRRGRRTGVLRVQRRRRPQWPRPRAAPQRMPHSGGRRRVVAAGRRVRRCGGRRRRRVAARVSGVRSTTRPTRHATDVPLETIPKKGALSAGPMCKRCACASQGARQRGAPGPGAPRGRGLDHKKPLENPRNSSRRQRGEETSTSLYCRGSGFASKGK